MGRIEEKSNHKSQFVSYRVFVYRPKIKGKVVYSKVVGNPEGDDFDYLERLLSIDVADPEYSAIAAKMSEDRNLNTFLKELRGGIVNGLKAGPRGLLNNEDSIFEVIEITPLVSSVQTKLSINGRNSCSLNLVDRSFSDFGLDNVSDSLDMGPVYKDKTEAAQDKSLSKSQQEKASRERANASSKKNAVNRYAALNGFSIREFDLVRVEAFSRFDETWQERSTGFSTEDISPDLSSTTAFTGLVVEIDRSASVSQVPQFSVSCLGLYSVFNRGTTVVNSALAQVISTQGGQSVNILAKDMNVYVNRFMGKSSLRVFLNLIDDYFKIYDQRVKKKKTGVKESDPAKDVEQASALSMPNVTPEFWNAVLTFKKKGDELPDLVPFLPMLICYHILKYTNLEPIVVLDDLLDEDRLFMSDPGTSSLPQFAADRGRKEHVTVLKPYLVLSRTSYENFDSSFMEPASVLNEIRTKSFYEIFEDRSGTFHFRFPRYNNTHIAHVCDETNTIQSSFKKSDSAVFNVAQVETSMSFMGIAGPVGLLSGLYFDRLSISRFGLRMPQKEVNPNSLDKDIARTMAKFLSGYNSALVSRSAVVTRTYEPRINVGDMVSFFVGPTGSYSKGLLLNGEPRTFVGYVIGISESISVSGSSSQTLELAMVRPVGAVQLGTNPAMSTSVTLRAAADLLIRRKSSEQNKRRFGLPLRDKDVKFEYASVGNSINMEGIKERLDWARGDKPVELNDKNVEKSLTFKTSLDSLKATTTSFKYIPDAYTLAQELSEYQSKIREYYRHMLGRNDLIPGNSAEAFNQAKSLNLRVDEVVQTLGAGVYYGKFLKEYLKQVKERTLIFGEVRANEVVVIAKTVIWSYTSILRSFRAAILEEGLRQQIHLIGDKAPRTALIRTASLDKPIDDMVEYASRTYEGSGSRKGAAWFIASFNKLIKGNAGLFSDLSFNERRGIVVISDNQSGVKFSQYDRESILIVFRHFLNSIDSLISMLSVRNAERDKEGHKRLEKWKRMVGIAEQLSREEEARVAAKKLKKQVNSGASEPGEPVQFNIGPSGTVGGIDVYGGSSTTYSAGGIKPPE